jgi:hypothetical protein
MLPGHRSRSDDFVCTPQPVSQVTALQSYGILLVYSVTACAISTNSSDTHIVLSNPSNIVSLTFHLSPTVAKASPHPKSRAFLLFDLSSLGVKARAFYKLPSRSRLLIPSLQPQPRHSFPHPLLIPPPTIHPQSLLTFLDNHSTQLHSLTT